VPVIASHRLVKEFGRRRRLRALDAVDLEVGPGEVFGLLGANGAGKTTLVKILLGLSRPTSGDVRVRGRDPKDPRARRRVGFLPEGHRFPEYLTGAAALRLFGRLAGLPETALKRRIPELLELVGLTDRGGDRLGRYSKGMTQRLGLAGALLDEPEVLFLDEPTDGVDPVGRRHIRDILLATRERGATIFINSHLLSEVERTCTRVAILHQGRVVRQGTIDDLTHPGERFRIRLAPGTPMPESAASAAGARVASHNGHFEAEVADVAALNRLVDALRASGALIVEIAPLRAALEDVFIEVVEGEDRTASAGHAAPAADTELGENGGGA
jgi:ABC-2 type transport system ATP-binding protein